MLIKNQNGGNACQCHAAPGVLMGNNHGEAAVVSNIKTIWEKCCMPARIEPGAGLLLISWVSSVLGLKFAIHEYDKFQNHEGIYLVYPQ